MFEKCVGVLMCACVDVFFFAKQKTQQHNNTTTQQHNNTTTQQYEIQQHNNMKYIHLLTLLLIASFTQAQPQIELELYASGFDRPVDITSAGDDRLFVTEQDGTIRIIDASGNVLSTPFLDIDGRVDSGGNEEGLLGLTFDPDYATNGYFYVNYTATGGGATRISRFSTSLNPNIADASSEIILFTIGQPYNNHNAGDLTFGPDGYLYFGLGDGGAGGDPGNRAQNPVNFLGKMLRIDVSTPSGSLNYTIPADNPFVGDASTLDEIWALGLRNPWRFSFDRLTNDMWIADVGQDDWEEIDVQPAASTGGENYGWRCYEGYDPFITGGCPPASSLTEPVHVYANNFSTGCSVTGGFVYRGTMQPGLYGYYVYADFCTGRFWTIAPDGFGGWNNADAGNYSNQEYSTFGEDKDGELFVAGLSNGQIYRVVESCSAFMATVSSTDETCAGDADGTIDLTLTNSATLLWSNGATTEDLSGLTAGTYSFTATDASNCVQNGVVTLENSTPAAPVLDYAGAYVFCDGEPVTVTAEAAPIGFGYQWYLNGNPISGETDPSLAIANAGFYTMTYTGICESEPSVDVIAEFTFLADPIITNPTGDALLVDAGANTYQWYLDGNPISGADQNLYIATQTGTYTVVITDTNGCMATSDSFVHTITDVSAIKGLNTMLVSPVPFNDVVWVELETSTSLGLVLSVQNIYGQTLLQSNIQVNGKWQRQFDTKGLSAGMYLLLVKTEDGIAVRKLVKR